MSPRNYEQYLEASEGLEREEKAMTQAMPKCPMGTMCSGMMNRRRSGFALLLPGIILILLGVIVLIEPRILVWLVAVALIVMGFAMLMFGRFVRKFNERH